MNNNLIQSVRGFGLGILASIVFLAGCSSSTSIEPVPPVEVRTVEIPRPAPIIPKIDQLRLRDVRWIIITPENVNTVFESLTGDIVLFALTTEGYEALALNISDLRAMIQQQQQVIAVYSDSYR